MIRVCSIMQFATLLLSCLFARAEIDTILVSQDVRRVEKSKTFIYDSRYRDNMEVKNNGV